MGALGGTRLVVAWAAASTLLLGACTGGAGEPAGGGPSSPEDSASGLDPAITSTGRTRMVSGIGFALPRGWQAFPVDEVDPADETARQVAQQLGLRPGQLEQGLATTELYLVSRAGSQDGFLPSINVYPVPGAVPADEEIQQDFARVGAEVSALDRRDTGVGEVVVVSYRLPASAGTIEGASVVVPDGGQTVIVNVSEVDRARADEVADTLVASLRDA